MMKSHNYPKEFTVQQVPVLFSFIHMGRFPQDGKCCLFQITLFKTALYTSNCTVQYFREI